MIKITIHDIPPSMNTYNGRKNCWQYRKDKQQWKEMVMWSARRPRGPILPLKKAVVHITYFFPTRGRRDPDNYSGKFILDGLTASGCITDDSFECIDLQLSGDYSKDDPRTEILIEALEK